MSFENEKIVENKTCQRCQVSFDITDKDLEFYDKVSPIFSGKKYGIPTPKLCPECREQRRLSFRNERKLYKRECDFTGKEMVSLFSSDKELQIYEQEIWWSDKWEALDYGTDFDFEQTFSKQFSQLLKKVPKCNLITDYHTLENSPYVNLAGSHKNCHFVFESDRCENCLYSYSIFDSISCIDSNHVHFSEYCYECIDINKCYNCNYCYNCQSCKDSIACIDCSNISFCFGCTNLNAGEYLIYNKQYTKDEYFKKIDQFSHKDIQKIFLQTKKSAKYKSLNGVGNNNATHGDYISYSENVSYSYDVSHCKDCKYTSIATHAKDCMDYTSWGNNSSKIYEAQNSGFNLNNILFCDYCWDGCSNLMYCELCVPNCSNCFGCVGLKNKQYCIFNKQYTKEEYNTLVPKIIEHMKTTGEWGEFFPSSLSPFGYNETVAQEYFPLEKSDLTSNPSPLEERGVAQSFISPSLPGRGLGGGFNWSDYEAPFPKVEKIIPANKLPDNIADIPDDILNWAIECEVTKKPFKIISQELEFYRKHNLPVPRKHPDQRHLERMQLRNPRKLYKRDCDKCSVEMDTTYAPEREETVYCEECYKKEVY